MKSTLKTLIACVLCWVVGIGSAQAITPARPTFISEFVHLSDGVVGALYSPAQPSAKEAIAVLVMHAEQDYLNFPMCSSLAQRGYTVLCANNAASKMGLSNDLDFERMMKDVAQGVDYLRQRTGVRKIVLLGHSGGGAMMTAYQNIAQNGLAACQGAEKIVPCSSAMAQLPTADGLLLLDANYGISGMTLLSLDPAITNESDSKTLNTRLNLFDPANGFGANGAHYTPAFKREFTAGVAARMQRLVQQALQQRQRMQTEQAPYADDAPFIIPGASYIGFNNKLFAQDVSLLAHTTHAWPLLHKDGSVTHEIVHSVRVPSNLRPNTQNYWTGALKTTVNRFLSTFALRVNSDFGYQADGITGVDWSSSPTAPIGSIKGVTVPLLAMGMTGNWEYLAAEKIYLQAASRDKSIAFVEGASHMLHTCKACEKTPGQYGDTLQTVLNYADQWLQRPGRFLQ